MSKLLAKILDQPERLVARSISELEKVNGYNSEDVRLLAENSLALRKKLADLGLDPDDTTGQELYHALLVKFERDSALIDKALGINSQSGINQRLGRAVDLARSMAGSTEVWVLKHPAAKQLLRDQPPKRLLKKLNYRSLESMLKRENLAETYLALPYVESETWQKNFIKAVAKLDSDKYELRPAEIVRLNPRHYSVFGRQDIEVASNNLIGAVGLWPSAQFMNVGALAISLLLLDGLEDLTHSETAEAVASLNPALVWWEQVKHLLAVRGKDVVSLNLNDVAANFIRRSDYQSRLTRHGRQSLWSELVGRYNNRALQFEETFSDLKQDASLEFNKLAAQAMSLDPTPEYLEI